MRLCIVCGKDVNRFDIMHYCRSCNKEYCHLCFSKLEILHICSEDFNWSTRKCEECGAEVWTQSTSFEKYERKYSYGDGYMPLADDDYNYQQALRQQYYYNVEKLNEELRRQYR